MNAQEIFLAQRRFFVSGETISPAFRKEQLKKLRRVLRDNEKLLYEAIYKDFRKSEFETYATELGLIYDEIRIAISKAGTWSAPKWVPTNLVNLPGKSRLIPEPLGNTLIIGAWNYPYQLTLSPLVPAIAAGNTAILKPSELAPHTSQVMAKIINSAFPKEYIYVAEGGIEETSKLLEQPFNKIFFTGSTRVGKIVMAAAAKNLTQVTLELGGKSPAIVAADANLQMAAKRIAWGKFLNAGQTCIAPDYLLVHSSVRDKLLQMIVAETEKNLGQDPKLSEAYVRIINQSHFNRLSALIEQDRLYYGGKISPQDNYISPTILFPYSFGGKAMEDEIFGPILPVIEFNDINEVISEIKQRPSPLALYLFSSSVKIKKQILAMIPFGGGAVNETIMHITNPSLPFGGRGYSGTGNYHGKAGFDAFTHYKSVLQKTTLFELPLKYPPYKDWKLKIIKWLMG